MKKNLKIILTSMLILFLCTIKASATQETYLYIEDDKDHQLAKASTPAPVKVGKSERARFREIADFETLTIDTRFNTPVNLNVIIDPSLESNELVITDKQYKNADIFRVHLKGQNLSINPTKIYGYRVDMVMKTRRLKELVAHGDNRVVISGAEGEDFYMVLNDDTTTTIIDSKIQKLHVQANGHSIFNGLDVPTEFTSIYANDDSLAWINAKYANIKISKGAFVKCEEMPEQYNLASQKTNTFIREPFDKNSLIRSAE